MTKPNGVGLVNDLSGATHSVQIANQRLHSPSRFDTLSSILVAPCRHWERVCEGHREHGRVADNTKPVVSKVIFKGLNWV